MDGYKYGEMAFEQCTFVGNVGGCGGALAFGRTMQVAITNCTFSGNSCGAYGLGGTLYCYDEYYSTPDTQIFLDGTILAFSSRGAGIDATGKPPIVNLRCCNVYGNAEGDWVGLIADQRGINGNIWGDPGFCDTLNGNFSIQASSPCMPDDLLGCGLIGAHGSACSCSLWAVDPEGGGDFPTIQAALSNAEAWDVVELRDGVYTGLGNRDISVPARPLTIRSESGDPSACVIDCQGGPLDYHRGFTFSGDVGQETMLRGVGITGGQVASNSGGGAILCQNGSPRLAGCLLFRNDGGARGGDVACEGRSFPALVRCTLSGSRADSGGGIYYAASTGALVQASIVSFSSAGSGIGCGANASPMLSCSVVYGNAGGDWDAGCLQDQLGQRYNMYLDPCFCDAAEGDYALHDDSPCAGDWYGCGIIGAMPTGDCGLGYCNLAGAGPQAAGPGRWEALRVIPSPFVAGGSLSFAVPGIAGGRRAKLTIHDAGGRLICSLVDRLLPMGQYSVSWDGTDHLDRPVPAGIYYCRLLSDGHRAVRPVLLVR